MFALQMREGSVDSGVSSGRSSAAGSQAQLDVQMAGTGPAQVQVPRYQQPQTLSYRHERPDSYIPEHWSAMEQHQWGPRMRGPSPSPSPGSQTSGDVFVRPTRPSVSMPPPSTYAIVEHTAPPQRNTPSPVIVSYCYTLALTYMWFVKITPKILRQSVSASLYWYVWYVFVCYLVHASPFPVPPVLPVLHEHEFGGK